MTDISASLQFNNQTFTTGTPSTTEFTDGTKVYAYCIGTTRYSYVLDRELGTDQGTSPSTVTEHVLWRDTLKDPSDSCVPISNFTEAIPTDNETTGEGYEMMGNHMRLTSFNISQSQTANDVYSVSIGTAFGDSDLLNSGQTNCLGGLGDQFCATSQITTVVTQRVQ